MGLRLNFHLNKKVQYLYTLLQFLKEIRLLMLFKKPNPQAFKSLLILSFIIAGLSWLSSCKDEPFEYKIDRVPAFSFRLDTFDIVTTTDVQFYEGPSVLHDFGDTAVLFQRVSLQAQGITPNSNEYRFIVDFDTQVDGDNIGIYQSEYDYVTGGINDMRLIIEYQGEMLEFSAVPEVNSVYFQVTAQREEERIMKGVFGGVIYKDGDTSNQAVIISSGVFQDINY